jgi:hypothetical protein
MKTKERARTGMFVRTEGLHSYIYVMWVSSKNTLFQSRDVQFKEEIKYLPEESTEIIKELEEEAIYNVTIPQTSMKNEEPQETGADNNKSIKLNDESSTVSTTF